MKATHVLGLIIILLSLLCSPAGAQSVTRTFHTKAVKTDAVTTGTMTVRKPDYISISTDGGREQLIMDGSRFTMATGGRKHVTDSKKNPQFATFQSVLTAVINGQPVPSADDIAVTTTGSQQTITITPAGKKKRQLFTSFVLVIDSKTSAIRTLRMNGRGEDYTEYVIKR